MRIKRYFIMAGPHENSRADQSGFHPMNVPFSAAFDPVFSVTGLLHDMLDHGANEQGLYHQEVVAFGRILATRVIPGVIGISFPRHSAAYRLGEELGNLLADMEGVGRGVQELLPTAPKVPMRVSEAASEAISDACKGFWRALKTRSEGDGEGDEDMAIMRSAKDHDLGTRLANWLKLGYLDACRRYGGRVDSVGWAFQDQEMKNLGEYEEAPEGSLLRAVFDTADNELKLTLIEPDPEYGAMPQWARLRSFDWWRGDHV